jgi:hypothetical protein
LQNLEGRYQIELNWRSLVEATSDSSWRIFPAAGALLSYSGAYELG